MHSDGRSQAVVNRPKAVAESLRNPGRFSLKGPTFSTESAGCCLSRRVTDALAVTGPEYISTKLTL